MSDELDDLLKKALARSAPPQDFTDKVMARVVQPPRRIPWRVPIAVAASVALTAAVWSGYRTEQARKHEGQLLFALQLASEKISIVDQRLKKSSAEIRIPETSFERRKE